MNEKSIVVEDDENKNLNTNNHLKNENKQDSKSSISSLLSIDTSNQAGLLIKQQNQKANDLNNLSPLNQLVNDTNSKLNESTSSANTSTLNLNDNSINMNTSNISVESNNINLISIDRHSINNNSNNPLNEKVASLASSIYTELEKIVKLHGRDTVKDLMSIVVNILEALDTAYQEKEELIVENELQRDDNEKLLNQYEREKQARKDTELKFFQSEDSFAEQKKEYDEKIKSLESIVRMIDLKSKNTSDHVLRLEEKETELKKEYNKLHAVLLWSP